MDALDVALFRMINRWPDALNPVFVFFSEGNKWGWVRILLLGLLVFLLWKPHTRKAAIVTMLAWPAGNGVTDLLKAGLQGLRPCVELPDVILRVAKLDSFGTASAHSANMAAVAFVMGWYLRPWGLVWVPVAIMTGLSRIFVGVHYPSQVLLGWLVGVSVGAIFVAVTEWISRKSGDHGELPEAADRFV